MNASPNIPLNSFAAACYEQNSLIEMVNALRGEPDEADCKTWNLSSQEWRDSIADALLARITDALASRAMGV